MAWWRGTRTASSYGGVNRWVRGQSSDADPSEALADFRRFPGWMWRNTDVVAFLQWLEDRHFTFLGARDYDLRHDAERLSRVATERATCAIAIGEGR